MIRCDQMEELKKSIKEIVEQDIVKVVISNKKDKEEKYNKPLNMLITNVKMSTSRNVLCKNNKRANATVNAIIDYLKDKNQIKHNVLL